MSVLSHSGVPSQSAEDIRLDAPDRKRSFVLPDRSLGPGQMAGTNPAVRPIVWRYCIAQFRPYLNG
jgi:hypothetical protein